MAFVAKTAKGLNRVLMDESIVADRLTVHISEVGPGLRAHPRIPTRGSRVSTFWRGRAP